MLEIKERNPFISLVLEVLDDPSKKEMIFYFLCYSQLVRREGSFHIELEKFLSCAYRNFKNNRHYWKDVMVEMNLFVISDLYGNLYTGKDIYKVDEGGIYMVSLRKDYVYLFDSISYKALKLWNILSRTGTYRKHMTAQDAVFVSALLFNDGLYEELKSYCEVCVERYQLESSYFRALSWLSEAYLEPSTKAYQKLKAVLSELQNLSGVYYGVNILKLRRDVEVALGRVERGKGIETIKLEFVNYKRKGEGLLSRLFLKFKGFLRGLFNREDKNRLYALEGALCIKNSRTLYIN
ncbi:MAG: hypothetical protein NZ526_04665 [Aquificaceae bacterium]|nr:hypothetical protein [Aquificaceae bacterium]